MSNTTSNRVRNYRPVSATINVTFESNITNDQLRSPAFWEQRLATIAGIRAVDVTIPRNQVRITRVNS